MRVARILVFIAGMVVILCLTNLTAWSIANSPSDSTEVYKGENSSWNELLYRPMPKWYKDVFNANTVSLIAWLFVPLWMYLLIRWLKQ